MELFLEEFASFLEQRVLTTNPFILVGDFNFHIDVCTDQNTIKFHQLLDAFNLVQHVNVPTHKAGHILDLVITRGGENLIKDLTLSDPVISDHFAIHCLLSFKKPPFERKETIYRKLKAINTENFIEDINKSELHIFLRSH